MGAVSSQYYSEATMSIVAFLAGKRNSTPYAQLFLDQNPYTFVLFTFDNEDPIWIQVQMATGQWKVVYENVCMNVKTLSKNDALIGSFARYIDVAKDYEQEKVLSICK